jgi:drug/metabolite transporter (DMT)-like permease
VTTTTTTDAEPLRASARREHIPLGIAYMLVATILFACSSAASKWLVATYPFGEVLFLRALGSLALIGLVVLPQAGLAAFRTARLRDHVARGVSQSVSQTFLIIAFSLMPLASATAINFSAPLFATMASIVLFHERVGATRSLALFVGFCGVLIVTQPGIGTFQLGALFALGNAILYGTVTAAVRGMTVTESTETLTIYQALMLVAAFALLLPFGLKVPTSIDALVLLANGVANGIGQYWWTRSLHLAPTSAVTPFYYFSLVWALLLGFLVWGDVPTVSLMFGSTIVVASGLTLLWRETRRRVSRAELNITATADIAAMRHCVPADQDE